jgi:hypothetical protein
MGWVPSARPGNDAAVGNTIEELLEIEENNLPLPNAGEWEIKAQRLGSKSLTTLIHSEPSPTAIRFVPQILLPKYGWPHQEAGTRYPEQEMSFRQTISGHSRTDRGFKVLVDRKERKIVVSFDARSVDSRHSDWLETVKIRVGLGELEPQPYWGFDDLASRVRAKLHNCFYAKAQSKKENNKEFFWYREILMLSTFSFEKFLSAIEAGAVLVDFDARTGHNHGTKFRLRQDWLPELFQDSLKI